MTQKIALGQAVRSSGVGVAVSKKELSDQERINVLEQQIAHMQRIIQSLKTKKAPSNLNKDGVPIGIECWGTTENSPYMQIMTVEIDGYRIGNSKYGSLSAAAEVVSGVRRSGWVFWKLPTGETLKELYKK
jgi:ribonuclease HII